eukprot:Phypoly_transcript_05742.p1 GENE.Phypoly_transcript_05742~~Phypoly_transcript_05742.p1  ORF type:complete len:599 (+),score=118.87 Phypoly_transcript_05742:72-1868(+)
MRVSVQKLLQTFYSFPFSKEMATRILGHRDLDPIVGLSMVQELGSRRTLTPDIFSSYLYSLARKGDIINTHKAIQVGRKKGYTNDMDYQDVLALLCFANKNMEEGFEHLLIILGNEHAKRSFNALKFAQAVKGMGYTMDDLVALENAWLPMRKGPKDPVFISQFFAELMKLMSAPIPGSKEGTESTETEAPDEDEGDQVEGDKNITDTIESLRAKNEKLQAEIIQLKNQLFNFYFKSESTDNEGKVRDWIAEVRRTQILVDSEAALQLLEKLDFKDEKGLRYFFQEIRSVGVLPTVRMFYTIIKEVGLEAKERWVQEMRSVRLLPNPAIFVDIIGAAAEKGDDSKVEKWVNQMAVSRDKPSVITYNTIIQKYVSRKEDPEKVLWWFSEMKKNGINPDSETYFYLIKLAAQTADYKLAETSLKAVEKGIVLGINAFHLLLATSAKRGESERVAQWVSEMRKNKFSPTKMTISTILEAYLTGNGEFAPNQEGGADREEGTAESEEEKTKRQGEARKWMRVAREEGYSMTLEVYDAALNRAVREGNKADAVFWLSEMRKDGKIPGEDLIGKLRMLVAQDRQQNTKIAEASEQTNSSEKAGS